MSATKLGRRPNAVIAAAALAVGSPSLAAPSISAVEALDKQSGEGTSHFVVRGEDFGSKDQGPAVLYDYVTHAYENGQKNTFHRDAMSNGQQMHTVQDDRQRIYDKVSGPEDEGGDSNRTPPRYITDASERAERMHRHPLVDAHYRMRNWAYIGQPMAYGGRPGDQPYEKRFERPKDNRQLYIAWWLRPTLSIKDHSVVDVASVSGDPNFGDKWQRGERFVIPGEAPGGGDVEGWLIDKRDGTVDFKSPYSFDPGEDLQGWIEIELDTPGNIFNMEGATLIGQESGATLTFPEDFDDRVQNWGGGAKFLRAGPEPFSLAITPNSIVSTPWGTDFFPSDVKGALPLDQQWNLVEVVADAEEGWIEARVNFATRGRLEFDPEDVDEPYQTSPGLGLLGQDTKGYGFNTFRISEVYEDGTIQRIVIADAKRLDNATHYELQRPVAWSSDEIEFAANPGQLLKKTDEDENLYVFVFNADDQVNEEGFPISLDGMEQPPKAPEVEDVTIKDGD